MLQTRLNRNTSWAKPTTSAATLMKALSPSTGVRDEGRLAELDVATRHADETDVVHREEDRVGAEEGDPEVEPAHGLVEHPAGDLRVPVVDGAEDDQDRRHPHHHVEVRDANMVSESGTSTTTLPRKSPVSPPLRKVTMKASANSIGIVRWMSPRQSVSTQL